PLGSPRPSLRTIVGAIVLVLQPPERHRPDLAGLRVADPVPVATHSVVPPGRDHHGLRAVDPNLRGARPSSLAGGACRSCEGGDEGPDGEELVHDRLLSHCSANGTARRLQPGSKMAASPQRPPAPRACSRREAAVRRPLDPPVGLSQCGIGLCCCRTVSKLATPRTTKPT